MITLLCLAFLFAFAVPVRSISAKQANAQVNELPKPPSTSKQHPTTITITILYDNNEYDRRLQTDWGFSCLVEGLEQTILFDTGGNSSILLSNMRTLGIDPERVGVVVVSHLHYDHIGGLPGFLERNHNLSVYLPRSVPESIKTTVGKCGAELIEVHNPVKICNDVYSTGELGTSIKEQSLVITTRKGLVVITGCAHPGIVNIVKEARAQLKNEVYLVLGGFHLSGSDAGHIKSIVNELKKEGVKIVAPCHCSGDLARSIFMNEYKKDCILVGVGKRLNICGSLPTSP
jgi:7,8-dihydropterin-6-yl-methyl-4-(beta-D-ribofuranosyl)aminobenzene 5'-phosphate synthase